MAESGAVRVVSAAGVPWDDVRAVFDIPGDPRHCFCQYFKLRGSSWNCSDEEKEHALRAQLESPPGSGVLAYVDGTPAGWCAVEPREAYPRLLHSKIGAASTRTGDDVWAVTCFVVRRQFRGQRVTDALLSGAIDHARAHGARVIEGYPVDTAGARITSANLYHGGSTVFERAGFRETARPSTGRVVVELELGR